MLIQKLALGLIGGLTAATLAFGNPIPSAAQIQSANTVLTADPAASPDQLRQRAGGVVLVGMLVKHSADALGTTPREVMQELAQGKSLEQLLTAAGKNPSDVIAATRTTLEGRLKQAVANGRITQAQANRALLEFDAHAPQVMKNTEIGKRAEQAKNNMTRAGLVKATADVTGKTPDEIVAELRAGKSLGQIARENGKTSDDVIAQLRTLMQERMNEALERAKQVIEQPGLLGQQ